MGDLAEEVDDFVDETVVAHGVGEDGAMLVVEEFEQVGALSAPAGPLDALDLISVDDGGDGRLDGFKPDDVAGFEFAAFGVAVAAGVSLPELGVEGDLDRSLGVEDAVALNALGGDLATGELEDAAVFQRDPVVAAFVGSAGASHFREVATKRKKGTHFCLGEEFGAADFDCARDEGCAGTDDFRQETLLGGRWEAGIATGAELGIAALGEVEGFIDVPESAAGEDREKGPQGASDAGCGDDGVIAGAEDADEFGGLSFLPGELGIWGEKWTEGSDVDLDDSGEAVAFDFVLGEWGG
jgi:hypothetical protein